MMPPMSGTGTDNTGHGQHQTRDSSALFTLHGFTRLHASRCLCVMSDE
jgi:hypothetical protein